MMNKPETLLALRLHSVTNGHMARAASARGYAEQAARFQAISTAAAGGRLLAPLPLESHQPDLVAACVEHGLVDGTVVPNQHAAQAAEPVVKRVGDQPLAPAVPKQD
jgi:hypothetical protein